MGAQPNARSTCWGPSSSSPRGATQRDSSAFLLFQHLWNLSPLPFLLQLLCEHNFQSPGCALVHPHPSPSPAAAQGPSKAAEVGKKLSKCLNITKQELRGVYSLLWCLPTPSSCSPFLHLAQSLLPATSKAGESRGREVSQAESEQGAAPESSL